MICNLASFYFKENGNAMISFTRVLKIETNVLSCFRRQTLFMSIYSSMEYNVSYTATEQQSVRATTLFLEKVFAVST